VLYGERHPFGTAIGGTRQSVERITRQDIADFHAQQFQTADTFIVAVGDVHMPQLMTWLDDLFAGSRASTGDMAGANGSTNWAAVRASWSRALTGERRAGGGGEPVVQRRLAERAWCGSAPVVAVTGTTFAHLFEHMMFQGSQNVPEMAHFALIEQAGGSLNGSTWLDRTNYYETLPAHYLELGLWLESDRLGWLLPAMTQEKLDNQRDVVKNERRWRVDNQPYGDWDERLQAMMYPAGPSVPPFGDRLHGGPGCREPGGRGAVLPHVLRAEQRGAVAGRRLRAGAGAGAGGALLRRDPARPGDPADPGPHGAAATWAARCARRWSRTSRWRASTTRTAPAVRQRRVLRRAGRVVRAGLGRASLLYRTLVREQQLAQDVVAYAFPIVVGASMLVLWATARPGVRTSTPRARADTSRSRRCARWTTRRRARDRAARGAHLQTCRPWTSGRTSCRCTPRCSTIPAASTRSWPRPRRDAADVRAFAERYLRTDNRAAALRAGERRSGE
jgi:hypothetical protein